ncbi:MAG: MFS transporter [Actinomycetota bacterium]|nr:MFS transporter [Actinomycetota bacterium]
MTRLRRATNDTFRSLRIRNYRLFFVGQLVSITGTWMQWVAQTWLIIHLGGSGLEIGIATGLQFVPVFFGALWGGLVVDRFDRRRIVIATQAVAAVLAVALGVLTQINVVTIWMVYVLAFLGGWVMVFDMPARQAFVTEMVGPEDVPNAVGLNTAVFNAGRIVGPAIGGLMIATAGFAPAFYVNAASYIAVIVALSMMNVGALNRESLAPKSRGQVREGLRYIWSTPELRTVAVVLGVIGTFGFNFTVILPLMAKNTFHGGAGTYSLLTSIMAGGSLIGSLMSAHRSRPTAKFLVISGGAFAAALALAAAAPTVALESIALIPAGAAGIAFLATANSQFQLRTPAFLRGRVMAFYSLVFVGGTAVGGPIAGWISEVFGAPMGFMLGAVTSGASVLWAVRRNRRSAKRAATPSLDVEAAAIDGLAREASATA